MPRVDRRKKPLGRGNDEQRQVLLYGDVIAATCSEPVFASLEEERRAWFSLREEVLRECKMHFGAGRRPWAYYRHELDCEPRNWAEEIQALMQHGLIDATEAVAIEKTYPIFDANQSEALYSSFDSPERIAQTKLDDYVLKDLALKFDVAREWHAGRARPELAERYRQRADCVRSNSK
jgi:hypothetical protein